MNRVLILLFVMFSSYRICIAQNTAAVENYEKGQYALILGNYEEAISHFSAAIASMRMNPDLYTARGRAYLELDDTLQGFYDLNRASKLDSNLSSPYLIKGNYFFNLQDYGIALIEYNTGISIKKRDTKLLFNRASTYVSMGMLDSAMYDLDQVLKLKPKHFYARKNRALIRFKQGSLNGALEDFNLVLQINRNDFSAYLNKGHILQRQKKYKKAIENYDLALSIIPNHVESLQSRAYTKYLDGQYEAAIADCNILLDLNPRDAEALLTRGLSKQKQNRGLSAKEDIELAKKLKDLR